MLIMLEIDEACEIVNDEAEAFAILSTSAHGLTVWMFKKLNSHDTEGQQYEVLPCELCTKISHKGFKW